MVFLTLEKLENTQRKPHILPMLISFQAKDCLKRFQILFFASGSIAATLFF